MLLPRDSVPEEELAAEAASKVKQSWFTYCSNEQCGNKRRESLLEYNNYFNVITYDVYPDTKAILWAVMAPRHSQPLPSSLMSITTRTLVQNSTKKKRTSSFIAMVQTPKEAVSINTRLSTNLQNAFKFCQKKH